MHCKASVRQGSDPARGTRRTPAHALPAARRGFTLIEILVVVAIIALLISILLPSLGAARSRARSVVCCSHLHLLGQAMFFYANDNQNKIPRHYTLPPTDKTVSARNPALLVPELFSRYIGGPKGALIPRGLDPVNIVGADKKTRDQMLARIFIKMDVLQCPSFPPWPGDDQPHVVSEQAYDYVVNAFVMDREYFVDGGRVTDNADYSKLDLVPQPGRIFYLLDGNRNLQPDLFTDHDMYGYGTSKVHQETLYLWYGASPRMIDDDRHAKRANGVFHDGHVGSPTIRSVDLTFFSAWPFYDVSNPDYKPPPL
jgi:prepilin-type N-terminal cleavage/methylation domain-containing protein/prepilin-type processing-associated H-X9-DG protein